MGLAEAGEVVARADLRGSAESLAFTMPEAGKEFVALGATDPADADLMIAGGYSIYIEGSIEKADGESCAPGDPKDCAPAPSVAFSWGLQAGGFYSGCDGVEIANGLTSSVGLAIPAVHWLHTDFRARGDAPLRAQWIADADLDRDGETTLDELATIKAGVLLPPELGYDFAGSPDTIDTALDFLTAQARLIGRDGWGECMAITPQ